METNDKTFLEMQQQIQQLRDKLDGQKIVNDEMLRRAYSRRLDDLRRHARVPFIAALAAVCGSGSLLNVGFGLPFLIVTLVMVLGAVAVIMLTNRNLPQMDSSLVEAGEKLVRFRKLYRSWNRIGLIVLAVWLAWLFYEFFTRILHGEAAELALPLACVLAVGVGVGLIVGLSIRGKILDGTKELLDQIEELKKEQ
jgi:hypothetical protein